MSGHYRFRRSFGNVNSRFRGATPKHFPLFTGLLDDFGGAEAAYSLRALSSAWLAGDVAEVRRSSDSTSEDFTASQITNGAMLDFVNHNTTSLYNSARYFGGINPEVELGSTVTMTGDFTVTGTVMYGQSTGTTQAALGHTTLGINRFGITGANAVLLEIDNNVYVLSTTLTFGVTYDFSIVRVGSSTTVTFTGLTPEVVATTTGDFLISMIGLDGLNSNDLDGIIYDLNLNSQAAYTGLGTSVTAWEDTIGSNDGTETNGAAYTGQPFDGFVSTWYDQSGNANNATQGTTTAQPKIVSAGALVVGGLDFDGVDDFFDLGDLALTQPNSVFFVHNSDNQGGGGDVLNDFLDHNGTGARTLIDSSTGLYRAFAGTVDTSTKIIVAGADALVSTTINGASSELALNGSNETGLSVGTGGMGEMTLGKSLGGIYDGTFAEFIIYATNQSANRVAIETNINAAYTIF